VQSNSAGDYRVVITNIAGAVTSAVATLTVYTPPPVQIGPVAADAIVLVNSSSIKYLDFQHYIQPYLEHFGVPYKVLDISTNAALTNLEACALIIIGHEQLDTNHVYLGASSQNNLSAAVASGVGLVNFDSDLSAAGGTPRYRFIQDIFGFGYASP